MRCVRGSICIAGLLPALVLGAGFAPFAIAQDVYNPVADEAVPAKAVEATRTFEIAKLTEIEIEILEPLGSKLSTSLDTFKLRLAAPIMIDGIELVPAGTMGAGEVVHAKKAGGMGVAGELVLAARYLDIGDRRVRLRSMKLAGNEAESRIAAANAIGTAGAATALPVALIGFLVKGGQIDVPEGTIATAKIAEDFSITMAAKAGAASDAVSGDEMVGAVPSPNAQIPTEDPAVNSEEPDI